MPDVAEAPAEQKIEEQAREIISPGSKSMANKLTDLLKEVSDKQVAVPPPKETAPEKPPEKPVEEEPLPEAIQRGSPKASEEFKKVRSKAQQHQKESEKYKAELDATLAKVKTVEEELTKIKASPPAPVDTQELEALKKQYEIISEQLRITAIERHPDFRRHFENRTTAAIEKTKAVIGQELTEKVVRLAQLASSDYRTGEFDKMIRELEEVSPYKASVLTDFVDDMATINYEREQELKKNRDSYDMVQKVEREKSEAAKVVMAKRRAALESASLEMAKTMDSFKKGDDGTFNSTVATRESFVKDFFAQRLDDKILAGVPVLAMEGAYAKEIVIPNLRAENDKLLKQIQEMTQATPKPSKALTSDLTKVEPKKGSGFLEIYKANAPG